MGDRQPTSIRGAIPGRACDWSSIVRSESEKIANREPDAATTSSRRLGRQPAYPDTTFTASTSSLALENTRNIPQTANTTC
jgi:hypothetical protein